MIIATIAWSCPWEGEGRIDLGVKSPAGQLKPTPVGDPQGLGFEYITGTSKYWWALSFNLKRIDANEAIALSFWISAQGE